MSSKKRGGLSSREYAAKMSGGKLNYKTGKISTPKKSSSSKSSSSSRYNQNQYIAYKMMDQMKGTNFADTYKNTTQKYDYGVNSGQIKDTVKKPSKASVSTKNNSPLTGFSNEANDWMSSGSKNVNDYNRTSQRTSAAKVAGASTGKNIVASKQTGFGKALQWLNESLVPGKGSVLTKDYGFTENPIVNDLVNLFGVPSANAMLRDDPSTGGNYNDPNTISAINYDEIGTPAEQRVASQQRIAGNSNPITNYGTGYATDNISSPSQDNVSNNDRQTSSRVSQPTPVFNQPQSSNISDILGLNAETPNTPTTPANATVQRPVGMGQFSSGQYGNGSGDYGISGGFNGGNTMDDEQSLLNKILGIPTANAASITEVAQASETPQSTYDLHQTTNPLPGITPDDQIEYINGVPYWKDDVSSVKDEAYSNQYADLKNQELNLQSQMGQIDPNELAMLQNYLQTGDTSSLSGNISGGTSTQRLLASNNLMGSSQGESSKAYDDDGSKQTKAAKKAWKELQKSINKQYEEDLSTGKQSIEKAKQEDLMKLSGLFGFANSAPNDEQRIQYQNRLTNDYASKFNELMKGLSSAKNKQLSEGKQQYEANLQNIIAAIQQQQQKTQQLVQQQQQQAINNRLGILKLVLGGKENTASDNPYPVQKGTDQEGNPIYVDGNKNSSTYGQQIYWQA